MRILVGLAALIGGVAACQDGGLATSSTSQEAVIITVGTDFGTVQVGQSSAPHTYTISPALGANSDIVNSITEACPDFSISATDLPADVYRTCEPPGCTGTQQVICEPEIAPAIAACVTEDLETYAFTATFTPTVAGPLSCVVTITLDSGGSTRTVSLTGTGMPPPVEIGVSPPSAAFGDVRTNTASSPATITVRDLGGSALVVSSVTVPAGYALTGPTSFQVAPGAAQALSVTCNPTAVGAINGSMTIASNDPDSGSLNIPLTCNGVTSNLAIAPSPATVPTTLVGLPQSVVIDLVNTGGASTTLTSVTIDGAGFTLTGAPTTPTALGPSGGLEVTAAFDASAHGPASGTLTVVTSDGTRTAQISASALLATMSVTPDGAVDLGPVCAGATASQMFSLIGNGDGPFQLQALALGSDGDDTGSGSDALFTLDAPTLPAPVQASGGNQVAFSVGVAPVAAGPLSTTVTVTTDIPNGAPDVIAVTATGLAPGTTPTPANLDLGSNPLDTTTIGQPILITNCSGSAAAFTNARIEGSDATEFAIVAQPPTSAIAADASATWLVVMSAHTAGLKSADFAVDFADGTTTDVPLTGEGLSPDLGSGGGDDDGATSEHNYYSCSAGDAGGLAPVALGLLLVLGSRRKRRA